MASTYSPKLRFELIGPGEQAGLWGNTTNKNIGQLIEQAIAGVSPVDLSAAGGGTYTLSTLDGTVDQSRSAVIACSGTPSGPVSVVIPTQTKLYVVRNDCGQTILVKTAAQVSGVTLLNGEATLVFCDGTNAVAGIATAGVGPTTVANGGTGATSFTGGFIKSPAPYGTTTLTSVSTVNAATEISGTLPVANGGTGTSSLTSGRVLLGNGTSAITALAGTLADDVLSWNGSAWVSKTLTPSGVASLAGTNIGVSSPTGAVTISLNGTNVTNALGYTPYNGSTNPNGYITSSALSGYAQLSGTNSWSGANTFQQNVTINTGSTSRLYLAGSTYGVQSDNSSLLLGQLSGTYLDIQSSRFRINYDSPDKPTAGQWGGYSDQRLKTDITDYTKGLADIKSLRAVNYKFNDVTNLGKQTNYKQYAGLIAQEVEQTSLATMITTKEDGYKQLDPSELTYTMINAIKELSAQVDALKAEVAALKGV